MTEPTPERLQKRMHEFGLTEREARVSLYLSEAEDLLESLLRESVDESGADMLAFVVWKETHIAEHFRSLHRELAMRVLHRQYPKGWGNAPPEDEDHD